MPSLVLHKIKAGVNMKFTGWISECYK